MKKLKLTEQNQTCINKLKDAITQSKQKKLNPGLVALYNVWPHTDHAYSYRPDGHSYYTVLHQECRIIDCISSVCPAITITMKTYQKVKLL